MSIFLIFVVCLLLTLLPHSAMIPQWYVDNVVRNSYPLKPWTQTSLATEARAYHQHLVNHCLLTLIWIYALKSGVTFAWIGIMASVLYPMFKEFVFDPMVLNKPVNDLDWRERLWGAILPLPLLLLG